MPLPGDFTSEYWKHSGSSVTVKLGVQFKNSDGHTYDPDWIATKTAGRATMLSGGTTYISKWLCY